MNSEELEQSLRSEFETYLNGVLSELRQESAEFQNKIQAEFDRHRAEFDEAFGAIAARFDSTPGLNEAFHSSVAEHLKLARDEGARIAANAMVEAEKLDEHPAQAVKYDAIRDAVSDISSKDSQSAILKTLVQHASEFAPRGAFFIIKSNHFAGWKVFGAGEEMEDKVREVHFPVSQDTILKAAVDSLSTVEAQSGRYSEDATFTDPLSFGQPQQMTAIPLVARGRGVAVMYVDSGEDNGSINREALETLVRVAGLTVELLAATQTAAEENRTMASADFEAAQHDQEGSYQVPQSAYPAPSQEAEEPSPAYEPAGGFSFTESAPEEPSSQQERYNESVPEYGSAFAEPAPAETPVVESDYSSQFESTIPAMEVEEQSSYAQDLEQPVSSEPSPWESEPQPDTGRTMDYSFGTPEPAEEAQQTPSHFSPADSGGFQAPAPEYGSPAPEYGSQAPDYGTPTPDFGSPVSDQEAQTEPAQLGGFDIGQTEEQPAVQASPFDRAVEEYRPAGAPSTTSYAPSPEPVVPAPAASGGFGRLSDRPVDLPIDVPEEERRLHNDARRFARLLVSEIKLYNEKKVQEGRQSHDLYDRLKEAIDRSREMYDKRVQPPVASKFDYFHYELLNSLADGSVERLGEGYPGASV